MNGNINIDPEAMKSYGGAIVENGNSFLEEVESITSIVNDLKEAWTGTSATKYVENIEGFLPDYEKFGELINKYGELLVAIGKDYASLEDEF